jgi:DNA-directed RNA polymerase specialized sigma24 family protein
MTTQASPLLNLKDRKTFARVHGETCSLLLYVAGQLGMPRDEREDIVQQAYLKLLESDREFTMEHARAYLMCAVRTSVIDVKRRKASRRTSVVEDWSGLEGRRVWESDGRHEAMVAVTGATLDRLAGDARMALLHSFYREGQSVKDIQERTGEATGTITAKLCRLRRQVAPLLAREIEDALTAQLWP